MSGSAFSSVAFFPLYNKTMPLAVTMAGGPHSVNSLSNFFDRGVIKTFNAPPLSINGCQSYKLSDHARLINFSPQYIQYLPFIFAAVIFRLCITVMMEPDLLQVFRNLP